MLYGGQVQRETALSTNLSNATKQAWVWAAHVAAHPHTAIALVVVVDNLVSQTITLNKQYLFECKLIKCHTVTYHKAGLGACCPYSGAYSHC